MRHIIKRRIEWRSVNPNYGGGLKANTVVLASKEAFLEALRPVVQEGAFTVKTNGLDTLDVETRHVKILCRASDNAECPGDTDLSFRVTDKWCIDSPAFWYGLVFIPFAAWIHFAQPNPALTLASPVVLVLGAIFACLVVWQHFYGLSRRSILVEKFENHFSEALDLCEGESSERLSRKH
jgi:hypothetical protein